MQGDSDFWIGDHTGDGAFFTGLCYHAVRALYEPHVRICRQTHFLWQKIFFYWFTASSSKNFLEVFPPYSSSERFQNHSVFRSSLFTCSMELRQFLFNCTVQLALQTLNQEGKPKVSKPGPTWDKHSHLLCVSRALINALIHACVLPAHIEQRQNAGCGSALHDLVTLVTRFRWFQLKVRHVVHLKLPRGLPWAAAGKGKRGALGQNKLFVTGRDLQAAQLSAETQQSCSLHSKTKKGQDGGHRDCSRRWKVKSTVLVLRYL